MSWVSSERLIYVQFKPCVEEMNSLKQVSDEYLTPYIYQILQIIKP